MANEIDLHDYNWDDLKNYPNIGIDKDNELIHLSFNGNPKIRPSNSKLIFSDKAKEEIEKCKNDIFYFIENYVYIISPGEGLIIPKIRDYQKETIEMYMNNNYVLNKSARRSGKTASATMYLAHKLIFNKDFTIGVVANQNKLVGEIVNNIKNIILALPPFLQHGIVKMNQSSIELNNGSKVLSSVISGNALRGISNVNITYTDEFSFSDTSKINAFMDSVFPVIAASPKNQIIITTTPNGRDKFCELWENSKKGLNDFSRISVKWDRIPGRDEQWKKDEVARMGAELFLQNYEVEFIGSSSTLLSRDGLLLLKKQKPIIEDYLVPDCNLYKEYNENSIYAITVDSSKSVGKDDAENDYISVNVLELNSTIEQVLSYRTNNIHYTELADIINTIGEAFDYPLCIVENNEGSGTYTANRLQDTLEYPNMYFDPDKEGLEVGIRTKVSNRSIGLSTLKKLIEQELFTVNDISTIDEFFTFVKKGKRYEAQNGATDDCIMSLNLLMYVLMDENNELEITIDDYLEGNIEEVEITDEQDVDFVGTADSVIDRDKDWLYN